MILEVLIGCSPCTPLRDGPTLHTQKQWRPHLFFGRKEEEEPLRAHGWRQHFPSHIRWFSRLALRAMDAFTSLLGHGLL
jgi:hypothetical protein